MTMLSGGGEFRRGDGEKPDGFFLSNGPGDPAATGEYAVPLIQQMLETGKPLFGICLGHQLLALAVGGKTAKMFQGHRGANHPVKRLSDGAVEITSMNHGFAVEREGLPANVRETHVSLFDDSNCGLELTDKPAFSRPVSSRGEPGADGQFLPVREVRGDDAVKVLFAAFTALLTVNDQCLLEGKRTSGASRNLKWTRKLKIV